MTFKPIGPTDQDTGKRPWQCGACALVIHTAKDRVQCDCPGLRGLGDVIHYSLAAIGIKSRKCGGCNQRRNTANAWIPFKRKRQNKR